MKFSPQDYIEVRIAMAGIKLGLINRQDVLFARLMTADERAGAFPGGSPGVDLVVFEDAQGKGPLMTLNTPEELAGFGALQLGDRWVFADNVELNSIARLSNAEKFHYHCDNPGQPTPHTRFELKCRDVTSRTMFTPMKDIDLLIAIDTARLEARKQLKRLYGPEASQHQPALASFE